MNKDTVKFITEIVKPWEILNRELSRPFSLNPEFNDYVTRAKGIAIAIKHFPESTKKLNLKTFKRDSFDYRIMFDLADSIKHGALDIPSRDCALTVSSMFERNHEAKLRFLRSRISIEHKTDGKMDFMQCSMTAAQFLMHRMDIRTDWSPTIFNNQGEFSDEIKVHASRSNQVHWGGMSFEIVQLNASHNTRTWT